jgi:crotonobetainyl-CoA:carnitine CoA-transferase CaiB-like acyl-CoA transferase
VRANGTLIERELPGAGRIREPRPPARFDGALAAPAAPAPRLGEHSARILGELGLPSAEVAALQEAGVVGVV